MELYKEKLARLVENSAKMASKAPDQSGHRILSLYREALNAEKDDHGHQHAEDDLKRKEEGSERFEVIFPEDPTVPGDILMEEQLSDSTLNKSISPDYHDTNRTEGEAPQEVESKVELLGPEQAEREDPIGEVDEDNIDHSNSSSIDSESMIKTLKDSEEKPSQRNEKDSSRMHHHHIPNNEIQKPEHAHEHEVEELEKTRGVILNNMTTKTQGKTTVTTTSAHNHDHESQRGESDKENDVINGEELDESRTHEHKEERKTEEQQKEDEETEEEERKSEDIAVKKKESDTLSEKDAAGDHYRPNDDKEKKGLDNDANEKSGSLKMDMIEIAKGHRSETKHALVRDVVALTLATVALISAIGFIAYTTSR